VVDTLIDENCVAYAITNGVGKLSDAGAGYETVTEMPVLIPAA